MKELSVNTKQLMQVLTMESGLQTITAHLTDQLQNVMNARILGNSSLAGIKMPLKRIAQSMEQDEATIRELYKCLEECLNLYRTTEKKISGKFKENKESTTGHSITQFIWKPEVYPGKPPKIIRGMKLIPLVKDVKPTKKDEKTTPKTDKKTTKTDKKTPTKKDKKTTTTPKTDKKTTTKKEQQKVTATPVPSTPAKPKKEVAQRKMSVLKKGSKGGDVLILTALLNKAGYNISVDRCFGPQTNNAVIAFQKKYGLEPDGKVGSQTMKKLLEVTGHKNFNIKNELSTKKASDEEIAKYLDNLKKLNIKGVSNSKKDAMVSMAKALFDDGFEPAFVAGILGNVAHEGNAGYFESSAYISNPGNEPEYLQYMDRNYNYRSKYSGKSIRDVGIKETKELLLKLKENNYKGKFGLGAIQWTGGRTMSLINCYDEVCEGNIPTLKQCYEAENLLVRKELKGAYDYVYLSWKAMADIQSPEAQIRSAATLICRNYEIPRNDSSSTRSNTAVNIYNAMMKK